MIIDSPIISGSYAASGSLNQVGNVVITGSLTVTGDITGSATNAVSASFAATAVSASYAVNATSASYAAAATSASYAVNATSASFSSTASYLENYIPPFPFTGSAGISGSLTVNGNITAQTLIVQTITSSQDFVTGSTRFGSELINTHQFTGSVSITGSLAVNGSSAILTNQTSSMSVATASFVANAQTASYVENAQTASYVQNAQSASYILNAVSASYAASASNALNAQSASYWSGSIINAATASYVQNAQTASFVQNAQSASYVLNAVSASFATSASNASTATSSSYALTASYSANVPETASYATSASNALVATSASYALTASYSANVPVTASYANNAASASYALTSSYSLAGGGFPYSGSAEITGSLLVSNLSGTGVRYIVADATGSLLAQTPLTAIKLNQVVTASAGQNTFNIPSGYTTGLIDTFINGTKLTRGVEYTDLSGTQIILTTGSFAGDIVEFVVYQPASGVTNNALRALTTFTASAGQTVFSASYVPGLLDIFYNGSRLSNNEYTANNGTFFTLATGSADGDILDVFVYSYQVGAFSGIGGAGSAAQIAYFNTSNSITGSSNFTISGSTMTVTGSLLVSGSGTFTNIGPAVFSGSITSTAGFTGSFSGTATSASYAVVATSASYAASASNTLAAQTASYVLNAVSSSFATSAITSSYADSLTVAGTLTAQTLVVQTITSSVDFVTGSTRFGSTGSNTHQFTGSVSVNGSLSGTSATFSSSVTANSTINGYFGGITTGQSPASSGTSPNNPMLSLTNNRGVGLYVGGQHASPFGIWLQVSDTSNLGTNYPLLLQPNGGNVGIGTTNPFSQGTSPTSLEIAGANFGQFFVSANSASIRGVVMARASTLNDVYIASITNSPLLFGTNDSEKMRITSGGNVGIGTTSPSERLTISGAVIRLEGGAGVTPFAIANNNSDGFRIYDYTAGATRFTISSTGAATFSSNVSTGGFVYASGNLATANGNQSANSVSATLFLGNRGYFANPDIGGAVISAISTGTFWYSGTALSFSTNPGPDVTGTSSVERMRITSGGNVGIGTTSPDEQLTLSKSSYPTIKFIDTTDSFSGFLQYHSEANEFRLLTVTNHPLIISTNDTERMRITSGGQISQTTSIADWSHVITNASTTSPNGIIIQYTAANKNNTGNPFLYCTDNSGTTLRFEVRSNGGIANFQANNVSLSDIRTKKDIAPLESYWDKFKAIEIVKFKYKDQTHDDFNIGVIAQQVEEIAPEFVDVDGWDSKDTLNDEPLKSIYTADLYHATIKVLQEAMAKITELEEKLERNNII
jgi:hypothetical protein